MKELIRPAERRAVVFPPIPCMVEAPSRSEVEAEEKACEAKAKAVEEAKAKAETLKEEKAEEEGEQEKANSPFLTRSRARALHESRTKLEMDEVVDDFVPEYEDEASGKKERVVRKRIGHAADEEDVVVSKKVK